VISPVIFMVVKGLVGLAIINFAPVAGMKFTNWKLPA